MASMGLNEIPDILLTSYNTKNQLCPRIRVTKPVYHDGKIFSCILLSLDFIWKFNIFYSRIHNDKLKTALRFNGILIKIFLDYDNHYLSPKFHVVFFKPNSCSTLCIVASQIPLNKKKNHLSKI